MSLLLLADTDIDPTTGHGPEWGKAAPVALLIIVLTGIALFVLIKSMNKQMRRVPKSFGPAEPEPHETEAFETEAFETDAFETDAFQTDAFETDAFEAEAFEAEAFETEAFETETFEAEAIETASSEGVSAGRTRGSGSSDDSELPPEPDRAH